MHSALNRRTPAKWTEMRRDCGWEENGGEGFPSATTGLKQELFQLWY